MIPPVGATCLFTFSTPFATLNGVYTIVKTMTFETALGAGVDFVSSLYTPAGRTQENYASEYTSFSGQTVLQLQGVGSSAAVTYYAPLGVLSQIPDPTVKRYSDVYLAIKIGAFNDEATYTWLKGELDDLVSSVTGNTDTAQFYSNPSDDVYLTQSQYNALVAARAANIKTIAPLSVQNQALQNQIDTLQTMVNSYRTALLALYTSNKLIQATLAMSEWDLPGFSTSATVV